MSASIDLKANRYRGAQPFGDDPLSRRTFFGRGAAAVGLTNQILANRLVVVYARSGVGKSSLLNAGVAPRLRDAGCQPLLLRVNDLRGGAATAIRTAVASEAARQGVEYVAGSEGTLWDFFKTVEFWQGDTLLTPVLVLDQFEELFTLQSEAAREDLLAELGPIVRGVAPSGLAGLGDAPPPLHVVLSLREEFLGVLDDAADRIPQIMDHRFRLTPLGRADAAEAMSGPAAVDDESLGSKPFVLAPAFVDEVLDYLSSHAGASTAARRQIEPFHLQLICRRIEERVAANPALGTAGRPFEMADFGGVEAMSETLTAFYTRAVGGIAGRQQRAAARRLCEEFLISPEGRRLSVEETEIRQQVGLAEPSLQHLMVARLLRTDRRSDATYIELGHDALVEPILATRRANALVTGWVAKAAGGLGVSLAALLVLVGLVALIGVLMTDAESDSPRSWEAAVLVVTVGMIAAALAKISVSLLQSGIRTHRRFARSPQTRRGAASKPGAAPVSPGRRRVGQALQAAGIGICGLAIAFAVLNLILVVALARYGVQVPPWASWMLSKGQAEAMVAHPLRELTWQFFDPVVMWLAGAAWARWGEEIGAPGSRAPLPASLGRARDTLAVTALALIMIAAWVGRYCAGVGEGHLPLGWPEILYIFYFQRSCYIAHFGVDAGDPDHVSVLLVLFWLALAALPRTWGWIAARLAGRFASKA